MKNTQFIDELSSRTKQIKSYICVGLDSDFEKLPEIVKKNNSLEKAIYIFNKAIIDATSDITSVYKLNNSFYAGYGIAGLKALQKTNKYIKKNYPEIKIIADCKRSEMKRSAELVAKEIYDELLFDAFTVTPWFGFDTLEPFQSYQGKAVFVLCHDSNPSAGEVQDIKLANGQFLYEHVTELVCQRWNKSGNVLMECPLTYPKVLKKIVKLTPSDQFFLIAGLGAQGGDISDLVVLKKHNFVVNASRSVIFASSNKDFDQKSRDTVIDYNQQISHLFTN
ncbi:orotidine-5'-phosphate decarboxylase [Candidatus Beckwithbacteria bacterium CG23_combo_of_CG06-09_8_20_14_all_34_8]|uniref:Orotidine-5'-phosphate decarboxylase n=1 Tax=Candidatus Beckwithbacteria bacterium CG23_combo_of_CG06-09_8_20_14_all_34_8 TaxID=1974497 RepID=A0A2H0B6D5_9BACT|nr:MAG: orotidine-5'-phosphate decarboxylase [Candidatus Beckwithbacteria bacterium CG23_combo_of_CG06-09_8_20_14_all_34_8]